MLTFERTHLFHSKFAEECIIVKYMSSLICNILAELWPLVSYFCCWVTKSYNQKAFEGDALVSFEV